MARRAIVELWQASNTKWYFRKVSANGEGVGTSQGYKEKRYAKVAIKREHPGLKIIDLSEE